MKVSKSEFLETGLIFGIDKPYEEYSDQELLLVSNYLKDSYRAAEGSGLTRIGGHIDQHDTGMITGYRGNLSKQENQQRNQRLLAKLLGSGYGVTSIDGVYIENYGTPQAKEVKETTFFVVDQKDTGRLERDITSLGVEFDQDSVLFVPKGGEGAFLIGTNGADFPGMGNKIKTGDRNLGSDGQFHSRVRGRPFVFGEVKTEHIPLINIMGKWAASIVAKGK